MKDYEWDYIVEETMKFNSLAHTKDELATEKYYLKACDIIQEEYVNEFKHYYDKLKESYDLDTLTQVADGIGDTIFVTIQAAQLTTPSSLSWEYIEMLRNSKIYTKYRDIFITPIADVLDKGEDLGLDVFGICKEVCRSNMTKIPTLEDVMLQYDSKCHVTACKSAVEWIEDQLGHGWAVSWEIVEDPDQVRRVVCKDQRGKVRKLWCFEEPNLVPKLGV